MNSTPPSKRLRVALSDPGMYDRSFDASTWEEVSEKLMLPASQRYTLATVSCGTEVVGWAFRKVGELQWETRKRGS